MAEAVCTINSAVDSAAILRDQHWMIPHFRKDALRTTARCYVVRPSSHRTGDPLYKRIARETAEWLIAICNRQWRLLVHARRGFGGHEGKFLLWTTLSST